MKYCLSNRVSKAFLEKADEIKIHQRDYRAIPDYIDNFSNKNLILELENELPEHLSWELIQVYSEKNNKNFYCAVANSNQIQICKDLNIKFYYKYSVTSFYELQALKDLGAAYILVGIPLIFDLPKIKDAGIPIRAIPNIAYENYLPHENGICGQWIRPEDVKIYEQYVDILEFYAPSKPSVEETLYHIYAENQAWPGNLKTLITNLDTDFNNLTLYDENFAEKRIKCKHVCQSNGSCHYCTNLFQLGNSIKNNFNQLNKS